MAALSSAPRFAEDLMAARAASVWSRPHLVPAEEEVVVTRPLAACVQPRGAGRAVDAAGGKGERLQGAARTLTPCPRLSWQK